MEGEGEDFHAQKVLETFTKNICSFNFDTAKGILDNEQSQISRTNSGSCWSQFLTTLGTVHLYEKQYISLTFLQQKGFFSRREPTARTQHVTLEAQFTQLATRYSQEATGAPGDTSAVMQHLCTQLYEYCRARTTTVEFLEYLHTYNQSRNIPWKDLAEKIQTVIKDYDKKFHHPAINGLRSTVHLETKIFHHLIQSQLEMSSCRYVTSLMHLHEANIRLTEWSANMPTKEGLLRSMFGGSSKPGPPALIIWLTKFKKLLMAKFALYFHDTLEMFTPPKTLPQSLAKLTNDFCSKFQQFQRKCDASSVGLILDTDDCSRPFIGLGYNESEKCADTYPIIYCCHGRELLESRKADVVKLMSSRSRDLSANDKIVHDLDKVTGRTYFLSLIEDGIVLVVLFESKRSERDSFIVNFMNEIVSTLRVVKLLQNFKAGIK